MRPTDAQLHKMARQPSRQIPARSREHPKYRLETIALIFIAAASLAGIALCWWLG